MFKKQQILRTGSFLAIITLTLFFGLYVWYSLDGSITPKDYFVYSWIIMSFGLTFLYSMTAFFLQYKLAKKKSDTAKVKSDYIQFKEAFRTSYFPLLLGGFISATVIFIFFNTSGEWLEPHLREGLIQTQEANAGLSEATPEQAEEINQMLELARESEVNLFSFGKYITFIFTLNLFYMFVSALFALFLKNRRI